MLQKLQQKIGEFKQQALARATATDIAANEHQQRIKVQEQLMEAKAKISFLQSQLDSSIQAKESADQSRRTSSAEIDQVSKQELETISQMETIIHTITSTTRVESMEHILLSLKQRIEEQRAQIAARRAVLEAVADEKARNIILANQLENAKSAIGKLETDLTLLKEIVRVQSLEATEARIHAGITNIANSKQATFSKDGTTLDELSNIVEKLVADVVKYLNPREAYPLSHYFV